MHARSGLDFPDDREFIAASFVVDEGETYEMLRVRDISGRTHFCGQYTAVDVRYDKPALTNGDELPGARNSGGQCEFGRGDHAFGG